MDEINTGHQRSNTNELVLDCAIMIVGAGPAGISTWLHLQKYAPQLACSTLVIEKAVFPRDKLCAGGLGAWCSDVLEHLEIELDIPSLFVSDVQLRFGKKIDYLHEPNCFRVVQRMDFDYALATTAVNRGLELHEDETLIHITRHHNRLIVTTNKARYRVQTLIGADGALSAVRRKMMPPQKPHLAPTIQIFTSVDSQYTCEFNENEIMLNFTPMNAGLQGYVWRVPIPKDGGLSIANGIVDFRIYRNKPRANMKKIFCRELRSRNIHQGLPSWSSHPIHWLSNEDIISQPNVILVGDAAGIEPALGGGIHISLSYGELAAFSIMDAFQNNDFSFHDYKKRLQSHLVGRTIRECSHLAREMYGGRMNPIKAGRKLFTAKYERLNLLSLLLPKLSFYP